MARGKFKGKPKRGGTSSPFLSLAHTNILSGGKHFSRNLAPLGPDGEEPNVESSTPDKWEVIYPARSLYTATNSQIREPKGDDDSDDSDEEEEESEEESEEEGDKQSAKPIIPNENPNLVKKGPVKASTLKGPAPELSRRERQV